MHHSAGALLAQRSSCGHLNAMVRGFTHVCLKSLMAVSLLLVTASVARAECPERNSFGWRLDAGDVAATLFRSSFPSLSLYRICVSRYDGVGRLAQRRPERSDRSAQVFPDCDGPDSGSPIPGCVAARLPAPGDCADFGVRTSLRIVRTLPKSETGVSGRACRLTP